MLNCLQVTASWTLLYFSSVIVLLIPGTGYILELFVTAMYHCSSVLTTYLTSYFTCFGAKKFLARSDTNAF